MAIYTLFDSKLNTDKLATQNRRTTNIELLSPSVRQSQEESTPEPCTETLPALPQEEFIRQHRKHILDSAQPLTQFFTEKVHQQRLYKTTNTTPLRTNGTIHLNCLQI
jgi:hypothetical protein